MTAPSPPAQRAVGHLGLWGRDPLRLLEEGATLGGVFDLRLWRPTTVGYSPAWNRFVLGDLTTFTNRGSLSGLSPHLNGGLVQTDAPEHRARRAAFEPALARRTVRPLAEQISTVIERVRPQESFDAAAWSSKLVVAVLNEVFFAGTFSARLLRRFLRPLDRRLPGPFVRHPLLFAHMNRALTEALRHPVPGTLAIHFADLPGGMDELRVALSAGYDTTAHTLAWLLFHVADHPERQDVAVREWVIDEVLRLYPAGWVGSRRCAADTEFEGHPVRRGSFVLYSPYLTHRDPALWKDPLTFWPERFADPLPAWGFLPFAAGERTCPGRPLARLVLERVLHALARARLVRVSGDPRPRAGITLAPAGPMVLNWAAA